MFFVGIFGINQTEKPIGTCNNTVCPSCGALTRLEVYKRYSYFHLFFIPTFKWNVKYYAKSSCCGSIYELDPSIGAQYEKELIRKSELMTYDPSTSTSLLKPVLTAARKQNQITVIALIVGRNSKQTA